MVVRSAPLCLSFVMLIASVANMLFGAAPDEVSIKDRAHGVRWVSLPLQPACPDDLAVELPDVPGPRQFAQFVYGTPESRRVAVVFIAGENDEFTVYVDRNRDRIIRDRDLVEGTGEFRLLPLDAERIVDDVSHKYARELLIQHRPGGNEIRIATATTIEHAVHPDEDDSQPALLIRQADGNANGLFSDPKDLLQVDLNGDGRFDPFLEVFPFRPILEARGQRWFVRGDRFGERLTLASASATGRLQLRTDLLAQTARIEDFVFTVSGEDGSVFSLTAANGAADLPVGRYSPSVLFISIRAEGAEQTRSFTFSRDEAPKADDWFEIVKGETTTLDPIGQLRLDATVQARTTDAATVLDIQPRLFTETGLLINSCLLGDTSRYSGPQCRTTVLNSGRTIGYSNSGFA
jgi:hypothetical protein